MTPTFQNTRIWIACLFSCFDRPFDTSSTQCLTMSQTTKSSGISRRSPNNPKLETPNLAKNFRVMLEFLTQKVHIFEKILITASSVPDDTLNNLTNKTVFESYS